MGPCSYHPCGAQAPWCGPVLQSCRAAAPACAWNGTCAAEELNAQSSLLGGSELGSGRANPALLCTPADTVAQLVSEGAFGTHAVFLVRFDPQGTGDGESLIHRKHPKTGAADDACIPSARSQGNDSQHRNHRSRAAHWRGVRGPAGVAMRVTAPSNPHGPRAMRLTIAALALLGAGVVWLALNALVMWVTQD